MWNWEFKSVCFFVVKNWVCGRSGIWAFMKVYILSSIMRSLIYEAKFCGFFNMSTNRCLRFVWFNRSEIWKGEYFWVYSSIFGRYGGEWTLIRLELLWSIIRGWLRQAIYSVVFEPRWQVYVKGGIMLWNLNLEDDDFCVYSGLLKIWRWIDINKARTLAVNH